MNMIKKVKFNNIIEVQKICMCQNHKAARSGCNWIRAAVDHERFRLKILQIALVLNPILIKRMVKFPSIIEL